MKKISKALAGLAMLSISYAANAAFQNPANDNFYEAVVDENIVWEDAKIAAEARTHNGINGHLVTITSANENAWIVANVTTKDYFLGASDAEVEDTWKWVTGEAFSYTNWADGEPNNQDNENFLVFWSSGKWNDIPKAWQAGGYIVEYESVVPVPAAVWLFGSGLFGLVTLRRKNTKIDSG